MGERLEDLMKSVLEDIKNQEYKQAYLFFGEEGYLKKQYRNKLLQAWNPDGDTMNESRFEGKGIDVKEVISLGETMPFFSDRRIILLENTGFFKNQCPELAEYLNNLPDYLYLLFVEEEVDKRSKMFKTVKQIGRVVDFAVQDEKTLMRWVLGIMKREGKQITQRDMEHFLSKTGTDMSNIEKELEKLLCYTMDRSVITGEDIDAVCTTQINNRIFAMVQAVAEQNQKKALDLYYDLLALKEPPMRILFLLARQFNLLLQVKELQRLGCDQKTIASRTGLQSFVVRNYTGCTGRYTTAQSGGGRFYSDRGRGENRKAERCAECGTSNCKICAEESGVIKNPGSCLKGTVSGIFEYLQKLPLAVSFGYRATKKNSH